MTAWTRRFTIPRALPPLHSKASAPKASSLRRPVPSIMIGRRKLWLAPLGLAEHFERRWRPIPVAVAVPPFAFFVGGASMKP